MSEASNRLPIPIAQMPPYGFWANPYTLGLTPEDAAAILDGSALPDQIDRAQVLGQAARQALIVAEGPQHRRAS